MSEDQLWEDGQGSVFRPSYSATWINCAGSLRPSQYARDTAGWDAAVGTVFHWLIAEWQIRGRPDHWLNKVLWVDKEYKSEYFEITVDDDMFFYAQECLDHYAHIPGDRFVETKVDISDLTPIPNQSGTADLFICDPGILDLIDWKYGRGVQVFAEKNTQELLYAWGVFQKWDWKYHFERIRLHIAQPRFNHYDVWEISREELIEWAAWAKERAHAAWRRNADRSPSPKACQWCKVRINCAALEAVRQAMTDDIFDDAIDDPSLLAKPVTETDMKTIVALGSPAPRELPQPVTLPTQQLARILSYRKLMEAWFSDIGEELTARALAGEEVDGWKVVEGRTKRRWRDDEVAADKLGSLGISDDLLWQRRAISPAQAERLLRPIGVRGELVKAFMKTIVLKLPGKPTLAPTGDNRLAVLNPADDTFDAIDDETT